MTQLRVALQSTFGIRCGVAEYSRSLAKALLAENVDVVIYGNIPSEKNPQDFLVQDDEGLEVERNWSVEGWSGELVSPIVNGQVPPIVHIQYESFLYSMKWFPDYVGKLKAAGCSVVTTHHSAGVPREYPRSAVDLAICHTEQIFASVPGRQKQLLELPGPYRKPRIGTFGLGRSHVPWLEQACRELGLEFVNLIRVNGPWFPQDKLIEELRTCDVIALPYPPVGTSVSSSAAKIALATLRPVVLSRVNWFSTIPEDVAIKHEWDYASFKVALQQALPSRNFVWERSWENAAKLHHAWYQELLSTK